MELFFKNISVFVAPLFYQVLYLSVIGTLIGFVIICLRKILDKKISPRWKCVIWGIALIAFIIPIKINLKTENTEILNISGIFEPIQNISYVSEYEQLQEQLETQPRKQDDTKLLTTDVNEIYVKSIIFDSILPILWICGIIFILIMLISGNISLYHKTKNKEYPNKGLEEILKSCKEQLGIHRKIKIILQDFKKSPSIIGIIKPKILITKEFLEQDVATKKYIMIHELSHYKRKDLVINYVLILISAIHWFNPFIWLFFKKIRQDIELATDEMAISILPKEEKKAYGLTLIHAINTFEEEKYTARILCLTEEGKNMERRIRMLKLSDKFKKNRIMIGVISIIIIVGLGIIFFIQGNPINTAVSEADEAEKEKNYEYKTFSPTFQNNYDFTQDMTYQTKENIYYKKIDNYSDYKVVKDRWNNILDMKEEDFEENFMLISAIENTSMLGLNLDKIEVDNNTLYVSLKLEGKLIDEDTISYSREEGEEESYDKTCISYKISRSMERENIIVTRNLRNDEKDMDLQMQIAEHSEGTQSETYSFQYRDKRYREFEERYNQPNSSFRVVPQDWKDIIDKNFVVTKNMPNLDFSNWKSLGNGFYALQITEYSEYLKLMNNYGVKDLTWWDFKNIYAIVIVRDNSDNTIEVELQEREDGKATLNVGKGGFLDVTEEFKYPGKVVIVPNYRSLEENYLEIKLK